MSPDQLDTLLERSAPATRAADPAELRAMIASAARGARSARRRRIGIAAGALSFLLVGGAGVATATDLFPWAPWAQDPLGAVSFTMANGFDCELRFAERRQGDYLDDHPGDPAFLGEVNGILEDWYRSTDVVAAAQAILPEVIEHWDLGEVQLQPGETVETLPGGEFAHREFVQLWRAWEFAIADLESEELARHGIEPGDDRFADSTGGSQIQCLDEHGEPYTFGARP